MVDVKLKGLTSDIALYYYMLGEEGFTDTELTEVRGLLSDKTNKIGLTGEDSQQLWEVCIYFIYPKGRLWELLEIRDTLALNDTYELAREWSDAHYMYNLEVIRIGMEIVKKDVLGNAKGYPNNRRWESVGLSNKFIDNVANEASLLFRGKKIMGGVWDTFRKQYTKYQEITGKPLYICVTPEKELKKVPSLRYTEVEHLIPANRGIVYRWGEQYQGTVFIELDDMLDVFEKHKEKVILNKCLSGYYRYINLIKKTI